jgi:hypothetical protein
VSMNPVAVSKTARRRIRTFSVWIWVWGALVLFVGALNAYSDIGIDEDGFGLLSDNEAPWEMDDPPVIEASGNRYSDDGSGVIRIPLEEHDQAPYQAILTFDNNVDLFVTSPEDLALPEAQRGRPDNIAYLHRQGDTVLVVPGDGDLELWVRGNGSWGITLQKAALREMTDGYASDTSDVFLVYRGDAVSARFIHKGAGIFVVTIQTLGGESDQPIIESGEVDQRLSWDPTDAVYFTVEADDGRGVWSIDIDELATDARSAPDPAIASPAPAALSRTS